MKNQNPRTLVQNATFIPQRTAASIITREEKINPKLQVPTFVKYYAREFMTDLIDVISFNLWLVGIYCLHFTKEKTEAKKSFLKMWKIMQLASNPGFRQNQDSHSGLVDSRMKAFWYLLCNICIFDTSFFKI